MTCKWYDVCPMKSLYIEKKISKDIINKYCLSKNNWKNCKRYQMEEKGIYHPDNMLPDGNYI